MVSKMFSGSKFDSTLQTLKDKGCYLFEGRKITLSK